MNKLILIGIVLKLMLIALLFSCDKKDEDDISDENRLIMSMEEFEQSENEKINRDPSASGNVVFSPREFRGMKLFMTHCNRCHPGGEKGVGPSLNDKPLPNFVIHFQIRKGLGDMPAFDKNKLSKEEVKDIVLFVRMLRDTKK
jgi:cytochrome c peroxidase